MTEARVVLDETLNDSPPVGDRGKSAAPRAAAKRMKECGNASTDCRAVGAHC